jgi:hypothetical protein
MQDALFGCGPGEEMADRAAPLLSANHVDIFLDFRDMQDN